MRRTFLTACVAVAIGLVASAVPEARPLVNGVQRGAAPAPASAPKISGQWKLNKDLSADPNGTTTVTPVAGSAPTPSGAGGGPYGGGSGGGTGTGRRGGGGFGGLGGVLGGGGFGMDRGNVSSEQTLQLHALMREVNQPPAVLNIVASPQVVTFTTDEGVVRKFTANGKKEKIDLTSADVETITKWDQATLTQEMKVGQVKVTRSFQTTEQGNQLVITVATENGGRGQPATKKYVYDKN